LSASSPRSPAARSWTEQIPAIAGDIQEHGDLAVCLTAGWPDELDTCCHHPLVLMSKVVHTQKEAYAAGVLVPNDCDLAITIRTGEEQTPFGHLADAPQPSASGGRRWS
jgi:hypothetical protein